MRNDIQPIISGQELRVFKIIEANPGVNALELSVVHVVPQYNARIHGLRAKGFNLISQIHPEVIFRGEVRYHVASYTLGTPAWPRPGFLDDEVT